MTFSVGYGAVVTFTATDSPYPHFLVISSLVLLVVSVILAFPYFYYLFDWLDPVKIVHRFQANVSTSITMMTFFV